MPIMLGNSLVGSPPGRKAFLTETVSCSTLYSSISSFVSVTWSRHRATWCVMDGMDSPPYNFFQSFPTVSRLINSDLAVKPFTEIPVQLGLACITGYQGPDLA